MKRPSFVSTLTMTGLAVAMAGAFAIGLHATQHSPSTHCLNGCGKKQTPAADHCCEEPKCDFEYTLSVNTARVRSFAELKNQTPSGPSKTPVKPLNWGPAKAAIAQKLAGGGGVLEALDEKEDALLHEAAKFAKCEKDEPYLKDDPFQVNTSSEKCALTQKGRASDDIDPNLPHALDRAKNASPHCREAIEADWQYATTLQAECKQAWANGGGGFNAETLVAAKLKAAEKAKQSMHEQLSQFIKSCKPFMKNPDVRDAVKKAQNLLSNSGGKYIPQNKRKLSGLKKTQSGRGRQQ